MKDDNQVPNHYSINASIDWSVLDTFLALRKPGGPDPRARLIRVFLDSTPEMLNEMRSALRRSDPDSLAKTAHSMKSGSMNVGATELGSLCASLEKTTRNGAMKGAEDLFAKLEAQYEAVVTAFRTKLTELDT
ncbi:MAG TPA: Hpt domain-containing protein [Geobacteraceae bacterium]|nr:Hpt domain-containing protein [Geobacteraceae bacterium]